MKGSLFQYSKNLEGTKTGSELEYHEGGFQYSKNLEGTKTKEVIMCINI